MNTKLISFSLWGSNPKYTVGALRNAELAREIYPDWICKFFVSTNVPRNIVDELSSYDNVVISIKGGDAGWESMFWRFETSYDQNVYASIFRDSDSRLSYREKYAVDEWLSSDKTFHIMRDHPYHRFPILGGMWGFKYNLKYPMRELLDSFDKKNRYGTDYEFFIQKLYPLIQDDKIVHDPYFDKKDFPQPRAGTEFVGDVFDENDNRHEEFWKFIR
jgi:hypothetical protein